MGRIGNKAFCKVKDSSSLSAMILKRYCQPADFITGLYFTLWLRSERLSPSAARVIRFKGETVIHDISKPKMTEKSYYGKHHSYIGFQLLLPGYDRESQMVQGNENNEVVMAWNRDIIIVIRARPAILEPSCSRKVTPQKLLPDQLAEYFRAYIC